MTYNRKIAEYREPVVAITITGNVNHFRIDIALPRNKYLPTRNVRNTSMYYDKKGVEKY
jgi:hypothetical protein